VVDAYFAQVLLPVLPPGSVIVLDNARFHQSPRRLLPEIKRVAKVCRRSPNRTDFCLGCFMARLFQSLTLNWTGCYIVNRYGKS
jgi:hypothetical protein